MNTTSYFICLLIGVMIAVLLMEDPNKPEWEKEFR